MIEIGELADWLGVDDDATLVLLEERTVAFVEQTTGRHFGPEQTFTEILRGTSDDTLWLNEEPSALSSVEWRDDVGDSWTAIAAGDSDGWELQGPRLRRKGGFTWRWNREYRVIYDFGYATDAEPGEIRQAVLDLTKLVYDQREINLALSSEKKGTQQYTRGTVGGSMVDLLMTLPWVKETLTHWRWRRVA